MAEQTTRQILARYSGLDVDVETGVSRHRREDMVVLLLVGPVLLLLVHVTVLAPALLCIALVLLLLVHVNVLARVTRTSRQ